MNTLKKLEQEYTAKLMEGKTPVVFAPGDTLRVNVRIIEGDNERVQAFEGVCIARKNDGLRRPNGPQIIARPPVVDFLTIIILQPKAPLKKRVRSIKYL